MLIQFKKTLTSAQALERADLKPIKVHFLYNKNNGGNTINVRIIALIIPPNIGAAMRCMICAPVPELNIIGAKPRKTVIVVIMMGRMRNIAPSSITPTTSRKTSARCSVP